MKLHFKILSLSKYEKLFSKNTIVDTITYNNAFLSTISSLSYKYWTSSTNDNKRIGFFNNKYLENHVSHTTEESMYQTLSSIPAISYMNIKNDCYDKREDTTWGYEIVKYGEFPQYRVFVNEKELETLYQNEELLQTGKTYIILKDDEINHNLYGKEVRFPEYYYDGSKYVRTSSGIYFKVEPIEWYIIKGYAIPMVMLTNSLNYYASINYIKNYLGNNIKSSIVRDEIIEKDILMRKEDGIDDTKTVEVQEIIDNIYKLLNNYYGNKDYKNIIKSLVENYHLSIDKSENNDLTKNIIDKLTIDYRDKDLLLNELVLNLNKILNELETYKEEYKNQISMIDFIDTLKSILNSSNNKTYEEEIYNDFVKLKKVVFPYISNKNFGEELYDLLDNERNNIIDYIRNGTNYDIYNNDKDFEINFRLKYQELLIKIDNEVRKESIVNDIKKTFILLLKNQNETIKSSYIKNYMVIMNKAYNYIKTNGREQDIEKAKEIIEEIIDYNQDINEIINEFILKFMKLERIKIEIEEPIRIKKSTKSYKLKLKY